METKLAFCLALLAFVASGSCQTVRFKVAARDLTSGDLIWGPPDPAARIYYAFGSNAFTRVAETETQHTANPTWSDEFSFQYVSDLNQRVKIEVIENDAFFDDKYGEVTFTMNTLVGSGTYEADLNGKGTLVVTYY